MKATELMTGDWVMSKDLKIPIRVRNVMNHYGISISFYHNGNEYIVQDFQIEPIPLTTEILEKNEYCYDEASDAWELIPTDSFGIRKDEDDNCFYFCLGIFDAFNKYSDITYHYITKIEYVHELQHMFLLCGIDKEIIL